MSQSDYVPRPERKATFRLGQRELSYISLSVVLLIVFGLGYGGYRVFLSFKAQRDISIAEDNMHHLYEAIQFYSQDFDSYLPSANNWSDKIMGYLSSSSDRPGGKAAFLHGPADGREVGYVYNDLASHYNMNPVASFQDKTSKKAEPRIDPDQLILLIERPGAGLNVHALLPPQDNVKDQEELYKQLSFPHDADQGPKARTVILYASGRVIVMTRRDMQP